MSQSPEPDRCLMPQMPTLCWDRVCPAAPQSKHSSAAIAAARLLCPSHRPRNVNKLLIPCNLLDFPLNPGFKQGRARRRSHQCIPSTGQSQSYCEPEVEQLHSQQELHLYKEPDLYKEPASSALAGGTSANETQISCPNTEPALPSLQGGD